MGSLGSVQIVKRPPPVKVMAANIQKEIANQLRTVGLAHVNERKKIVANFEHEIKFGYRISITEKQITLSVNIENAGDPVSDSWTIGDLWRALDKEGTAPHTIKPKNEGGKLRFEWGGPGSYEPHTRPVARSGGPGTVQNGEMVYRKMVSHPGFEPRKFSEVINKRLKRQFDAAVSRGLRLGTRRK